MKSKLLHLLELQLEKVLELNTINALDEFSETYLLLNDFPKAIQLIELSLKLEEDPEYMRNYHYYKMVKYVIRAGDRDTFNLITENIESDYREAFLAVLDLKHKDYASAFKGLSNIKEDDYEFESEITELIKDILPRSIRLFPIDELMKGLPTDSLKNQIFNHFSTQLLEKSSPTNKKEIIDIFKKHAVKDDKKSYINDCKALVFAKDNNYKKSIKYAAKACDLRELGLLKDITKIFKQNNEIDIAIDAATLAVEKSKQIDWEYYSQSMGTLASVNAQSQYAIHLIEYLIILCRLHHNQGSHTKTDNLLKQIQQTIDSMPEEDHYIEWKIYQCFNLIEFGIELNNINLVKINIEKYRPLEIKNIDALTSTIDTTILDTLTKHCKLLNNKSIKQFINLMSKPINVKTNDFNTLISWSKLLETLNKTEQARKLSSYLLKSIKKKDDLWSIYDIAPIHFNLHSDEEIEALFNQIGTLQSAYYLNAIAKDAK